MILDSDVLIDILRKHPPAVAWFGSLTSLPPVCGIAALELIYGVRDTAELTAVQKFLARFALVWPDIDAMTRVGLDYAPLKLSHSLGLMDALIASTAIGVGETLATFNRKHFSTVPGLKTVQPYVR
jgi:predicted nucleic acid-binding protein